MKVELLPFEQDICLAFATVYSYPQEDWEDSKALLSDLGTNIIHREQTLQKRTLLTAPVLAHFCMNLCGPLSQPLICVLPAVW